MDGMHDMVKLIGGKRFIWYDKKTRKPDAEKEAIRLRDRGYNIRVIKEGGYYNLFGRKAK